MIDKLGDEYFSAYTPEEKNVILSVKHSYEELNDEEKSNFSFFDIIHYDKICRFKLSSSLNFFLQEKVAYSDKDQMFLVFPQEDEEMSAPIGIICRDNYNELTDLIFQKENLDRSQLNNNVKFRNKSAKKFWEKIQKGKKSEKKIPDKKMELANLISSLSIHCKGLNMSNIWDLTVFQLYDQFERQQIEDGYSIGSSSIAAWGDKDNKFDHSLWFSLRNMFK
jgi:hypothetical protein